MRNTFQSYEYCEVLKVTIKKFALVNWAISARVIWNLVKNPKNMTLKSFYFWSPITLNQYSIMQLISVRFVTKCTVLIQMNNIEVIMSRSQVKFCKMCNIHKDRILWKKKKKKRSMQLSPQCRAYSWIPCNSVFMTWCIDVC